MLKDLEVPVLAEGSQSTMPASSIMAALIAEQTESQALCAVVASAIVSNASSTCGSRAAIAAAFDALHHDAVPEMLRGRGE